MLGGAAAISLLLYLNRPPSDIAEPEYVPVTVDVAEVRRLHAQGLRPSEIARQLRIGRTSVWRALRTTPTD